MAIRFDLLNLLADHLESPAVTEENFDIYNWKCETTACAIGHAAGLLAFQKAGLSMEEFCGYLEPHYAEEWRYPAISRLLEISEYEACYLFSPLSYPKYEAHVPIAMHHRVAHRIRAFVTKKKEERK